MQTAKANFFMRHDTFFGVCEALGHDFGFNANYLRIVFAVGLLFNAEAMIAAYLAIGAVVAAVHYLVPARRAATAKAEAAKALTSDNDRDAMALAA